MEDGGTHLNFRIRSATDIFMQHFSVFSNVQYMVFHSMVTKNNLILASASVIRKQILEAVGVTFEVVPSSLDEDAILQGERTTSFGDQARLLAREKSLLVSRCTKVKIVLGADQILCHGDMLLRKPRNMLEARARLQRLRGETHILHSAAALCRNGEVLWEHEESCLLVMRNFTDDFLDDHLARSGKELLSSVGAYRLEGSGIALFERIDGDYFTALGLPLLPLLTALRALDVMEK